MDIERAARQAFEGLTLGEQDLAQELVRFEHYDAKKSNVCCQTLLRIHLESSRLPKLIQVLTEVTRRVTTELLFCTWIRFCRVCRTAPHRHRPRLRPAESICIVIPWCCQAPSCSKALTHSFVISPLVKSFSLQARWPVLPFV